MIRSTPGVCAVTLVQGPESCVATPDVLIEVPHGATRTAEYEALRARLAGPFPEGLDDFFHVNTDAGAPELAFALARRFVEARPAASVLIVRALIPRTFVDVNRVLDISPEAYREGKVTPGMPPYVRAAPDKELLRGLHAAYVAVVDAAMDEVCGAGGRAVFLHTYAPKSVDVEVDDHIGPALRAAYAPGTYERWPLRPEVDLIGTDTEGRSHLSPELRAALHDAFAAEGVPVADGATYPLHPSTQAFRHAARFPGRCLCVEVRRDLVAAPFDPFAEMRIDPVAADRLGGALARALLGV